MNRYNYRINLKNTINIIILLVLILTPLFSFQESISLIFGGIVNNSTTLTSSYIKGIKDFSFILIILISTILIIKKFSINRILLSFLFTSLIIIILPAFYFHDDIIIFLSGIRWLMPFILALFLINNINQELLYSIGKVLFYLFIVHFILQIFQLFFAGSYFGLNTFGLSIRNPGIFFIPSTAASFTILVLFFSKYYMDKKLVKKLIFLIPISIFLTASGTGIAVYIIFLFMFYLKKPYLPLTPLVLIFIGVILIFSLDTLSGRAGLMEKSLGTRLIIFRNVLNDGSLLSNNFGYGTSTGLLITNKYGLDFEIAIFDSWYATAIVNLGLLNSLIIFILILFLFIYLSFYKRKEQLLFFIIYLLIGTTTVFTESYPINLLFAILLAYYLRGKSYKTSNNTQ